MGKQVKGWTPPEEDLIVTDTVEQEKPSQPTSTWTPPESDSVVGPKKKDESISPSSSASQEPGKPSVQSTAKSTSTPRKKYQYDPSVSKWTNLYRELVDAYNTPISEEEKAKEKPDPLLNAIKRGSNLAKQAGILGPTEGKPSVEEIKSVADLQKKTQGLPASDSFQKFSTSKTFGEALTNLAKDPAKIVVELTAESMSSLVQYGAARVGTGAAIGSVVPLVGTSGGAIVGLADTSLGLEFTGDFLESLQVAGVDTSDPAQLQRAFEDEEIISKARAHAYKKSIPIALFDLVSGGIAGKIVSKPAKSLIGKAGQGGLELAAQALFDAGGEFSGQVVAGDEIDPAAIIAETISGVATSPAEIALGATKSLQQTVQEQTEKNVVDQNSRDNAAEAIQQEVEQNEELLSAGQTDIQQPITTPDEATQVAPTTTDQTEAVPETPAQEESPVQAEPQVKEAGWQRGPVEAEEVPGAVIPDDVNIPTTQYITEEESGTYNFERTQQPQQEDAVQIDQSNEMDVRQPSGDGETVGTRDAGQQEVAQESQAQQEAVPDESAQQQQQEITFEKRFRGPQDIGGLKGIPPKNQFKLNQGPNFERVQIILDDAEAELYQRGARAKRNPSTSTDPSNRDAIAFSNRVNQIARENRDKNKEVVLDFRKKESGTIARTAPGTGTSTEQDVIPSAPALQQPISDIPPTEEVHPTQATGEISQGPPAPPPLPPGTATATAPTERTPKERKTFTGIKNDPNISEAIKQGISEEGKTYIPRSLTRVTAKEADAIIDTKGLDESIKMYLDDSSRLHPDVDVAVGAKLFDRLQSADNTQDAIRVFEKLAARGTELGQAVNAFKLMRAKTMAGIVNKSVQQARKKYREKNQWRSQDAKKAIDKINTDAVEQVLKSQKVRQKISLEVKKGSVKKAIDFLEGLKVDTKGKALDVVYGVSAATWNAVISAVQKGLQTGLTISQAINKAVSGVKDPAFKRSDAVSYLDDQLKGYRVSLDPARAIKAELASSNEKIDDIVRQHYSQQASTKKSLIDKLIKDGNVPADQAQAVADELSAEFDRLTRAAKEKALKKLLPKESKNVTAKAKKEVVDQLVEQSNLGALSEEQYADVITDKLGVPKLTEQQLKEVRDLTDKIQKAKGDTAKAKAGQDLMNYIENLKGWNWFDATQAIWYANILSGPTTWLVTNPFSNLTNLLSELAIDISQNPKNAGFIISRVATGLTRGLIQAGDVLKTGYSPFKGADYKTEAKPLLERISFKGGKINPLNWLKYVTRAIKAGDVLFFHPLKEQRLAVLALQEARKNGRTAASHQDMHNLRQQLLKEDYDGAMQQAESEGFSGTQQRIRAFEILEEQRPEYATAEAQSFAARATFNIKPEGTLGQLAEWLNVGKRNLPVLNFIMPFVNTPINVANEYLNYMPIVGFTRVVKGSLGWREDSKTYRKLTNEERARIAIKATIGTLAMTALYLMDDPDDKDSPFEITANGTGDTQKNYELERTGWRPYSIRVGDTWISYKYTPMAIPMASIGFAKDAERYKNESKISEELWTMGIGSSRFLMDMSALSGLSDFFEIFSKENISQYGSMAKKLMKTLEKTVRSVVVPNYFTQMSRLVQEFTESPIKRADGLGDSFIRDVPVLRDKLGNLYDAFGDPVVPKQLEKFIPLNTHRTPQDVEMFDFLKDKNLFVGKPSPKNVKPNGTPMTEDEYNTWALASAKAIKARLKREYRIYLRQKNKEVISDWFDQVKQQERKRTKVETFGYF